MESFPVGHRLAFDAAKGRLWVVCHHCERWNLTPIEERWEAVEDCERMFRTARQRVCTDNIGLARVAEQLELVRIGAALRPEFAAWRYGDQFGRRRRRSIVSGAALALAGGAAAAGVLALGVAAAGSYWIYRAGEEVALRLRGRRLIARIPAADGQTLTVLGEHLSGARLSTVVGESTGWSLRLPHSRGVAELRDEYALRAAATIMPAINGTGGTRRIVDRAVARLENFDDPTRYLLSAAAVSSRPGRSPGTLRSLPTDVRLAIEMAANEETERCLLEGEMWLIEMAWQEAEEIAAIADGLAVPAEVERRLEELRKAVR
ncbi:MAG: hypothetical protein JSW71_17935 [Gemmatimonadota bacterium]|nr:MAG: hypothetical protein JSW71_17935 [Gemmatimonadota bacterium]